MLTFARQRNGVQNSQPGLAANAQFRGNEKRGFSASSERAAEAWQLLRGGEANGTFGFGHNFGQIPVHAKLLTGIQPKLRVSSPADVYEQEADRMAADVMSLTAPQVQHNRSCAGECPGCQTRPSALSSVAIPTDTSPGTSVENVSSQMVEETLGSPGQPLDSTTRSFMESRFGHDFSHVRIHTDTQAGDSARALDAFAYTVGKDMVFGAGRYQPQSTTGRQLLAHELSHTIQQGAASGLAQSGRSVTPEIATHKIRPTIQRAMAFEFQTKNKITTNKGKKFPRKFPNKHGGLGTYFHKGKSGVELQTDTGSVAEFETQWFVQWSKLKAQIDEAASIAGKIVKDPKTFPFSEEKALKDKNLLKKDENLEVEINDSAFNAAIQLTEGIALPQFESLLKQHERAEFVKPTMSKTQNIVAAAKKSNQQFATTNIDNLRGFVEVIVDYILRGQEILSSAERVSPVKARFRLMHRTNFSSMFNTILTKEEQALFRDIVNSNAIPRELKLQAADPLFVEGYWGHLDGQMALFREGKVEALATEDKQTIHDCSAKQKTPGIDSRKCGMKIAESDITIGAWLRSIVSGKKDALSPPHHGSESMGKHDVRTKGEERGLALFEVRGFLQDRTKPANQWVNFAEALFAKAAACRPRTITGLNYDGNKPFDTKKCP
jgi:hypothetical protein